MYVCICMYIYMYIHTCVYFHLESIDSLVRDVVYEYDLVHGNEGIYICMYVCICIYICIYMYIWMYIYIYI